MTRKLILFFVITTTMAVKGQVPVIGSVEPAQAAPGQKIVITGSGFSATASDLDVWFENVKGTITASSNFAIEVTVPPGIRLGNIVVINKASKLSARSGQKFVPVYGGEAFDETKVELAKSFPGSTELFDVCTCDFDVDGKTDLVASKSINPAADLLVMRNTSTPPSNGSAGDINFATSSLNLSSPTFNLTCGDLNGDGKPELLASRGGATLNEVFIRLNNSVAGNIAFSAPAFPNDRLVLDVTDRAFRMVIRDLNHDGKPEVIVSNANGNKVYVFLNQSSNGTLSINPTPLKFTVDGATNSYGIDVQDMDGDGKADIILNQFNKPDLFVLRNTSTSVVSFATAIPVSVGGATGTLNHLVTADFNNDGKIDVAVTNSTVNNKAHVVLNNSTNGTFSFATPIELAVGDGPFGIDAGDLDGDGDVDLLLGDIDFTANPVNNEFSLLINDGNESPAFAHKLLSTGTPAKKSRNVRIADFDNDGKPDFAFTTVGGNSLEVWRNKNCFVPQIQNETPLTICNGQTLVLGTLSNPGATYQWKESGSDLVGQTSATLSITTPGSYSVVTTSEAGACVKTTATIAVTSDVGSVTQNPTIANTTAGVISVCLGATLQLNTSDTEPTYKWSGPGFSSANQNNSLLNVTANEAGIYTLQLINGVCKSNETTVRVDVVNLESFVVGSNVTSNTICQGGNLILSTASQPGHTYQWEKDGTDISGQTNSTLTVTQDGNYLVRVTNPQSCSIETDALAVAVLSPPSAAFSSTTTACIGKDVTFTDQSTADSRADKVYNWNFGDTQTSTAQSPVHAYSAALAGTVSLTVSYNNVAACSSNTTKAITIVAPATLGITAASTGICPDEQIDLSIPSSFTLPVWNTTQTTSSISVTAAGDYSVTAQDANQCTSSASVTIQAKPVPTITIVTDPSPASIAPGLTVQLVASGADSYSWVPTETLTSATIANPVATPTTTTTYVVTGSITNGCSADAEITVEVAGELRITNVFSPNGDGINDLWVIPGITQYLECTLSLFDASGRKIFEKRGYQNDWDGTYEGKQVPKGTYYYVIGGCPDKTPVTGHLLVAH